MVTWSRSDHVVRTRLQLPYMRAARTLEPPWRTGSKRTPWLRVLNYADLLPCPDSCCLSSVPISTPKALGVTGSDSFTCSLLNVDTPNQPFSAFYPFFSLVVALGRDHGLLWTGVNNHEDKGTGTRRKHVKGLSDLLRSSLSSLLMHFRKKLVGVGEMRFIQPQANVKIRYDRTLGTMGSVTETQQR